jgi:CubicO group peptidase (beta-lactamase class C family)
MAVEGEPAENEPVGDWPAEATADFEAVDALAGSYQRGGGQPGLAYGIVAGGRLVHAGGLGQRRLGGPRPDADTVFRIASMTKSFTASAVLALRDDGALALDDLAEEYVPELRGWRTVTPDAARIRIRHLLTMTAGFPTDDPWGDRQQGTPPAEFSEFLSGGVSFAWAPGTRFEYSNLGYAILGRVISAAARTPYPQFVKERLLAPLGLSRTGFEASDFDPDGLAAGYRRNAGAWSEIIPDPCGAFAPMGGIFSCVRDLAAWVAGLAGTFPPGEEGTGGPHPLRRATRREMQLPQVATGPRVPVPFPGGPAGSASSYGFGLFAEEDPAWGRVVQHSGGYPGFGSNMRWHPATGTGVIVLGNSTYAAVSPLAARILTTVLRRAEPAVPGRGQRRHGGGGHGYATSLAPAGPWAATLAARDRVTRLLRSWDDAAAQRLFSENVALDEPFFERRRKAEVIRERIGDFRDDDERAPEFDSPAHCRWWLAGERGVVQAELRLTPERHPRVQSLTLAVPPAAGSPLQFLLDRVITLMNDGAAGWPSSLPAAGSLDTALLACRLRMAAAWSGRCRPGAYRAGDGDTSATVELDGELASLVLAIVIDQAECVLQQADIMLDP